MINPFLNQLALAQQQAFGGGQNYAHNESILRQIQSMAGVVKSWAKSDTEKMEDDLQKYLRDWDK